ncbi:MAG: prepilin-type N-terminal cleavage/methylation domain-containing protein [Desulfobulbales bacterium]|nr:prepilin-type N-terminal cleavage/methylation domain-containing protein [Desulfobulbales bacterium]
MADTHETTGSRNNKPIYDTDTGFTLVEVLLAFIIFSILFITIYTSYTSSFKTIKMTESRMELHRKAAIVLERISEDLQATYLSVLPPNSFGEPSLHTQFLGTDSDISGREADTLEFFSRVPSLFGDEDAEESGQRISYGVDQGSGDDELVLLRSENPEFVDISEEKEGLPLSDGLQSINFIYFDDAGDPHDNWDSESEDFAGRLPRMVSVSLAFINYENREAPLKVMTSVSLPVNYRARP